MKNIINNKLSEIEQNEKKALEKNLSTTSGDADDSYAVTGTVHSQRESILG